MATTRRGKDVSVRQAPHDDGEHAMAPVRGRLGHNRDVHDTINARKRG